MPTNKKTLKPAFTLAEAMVVTVIAALFVVMAMINLGALVKGSSFKAQANELVGVLNMAANSAAQSDRRYEVFLDLIEQKYILRQLNSANYLADIVDEDIIIQNYLSDDCRIVYILFDDLLETDQDHQFAFFRVGNNGFQNGGKIVLIDEEENPYTVIVNRINRIVELKKGEVDLPMPLEPDQISF